MKNYKLSIHPITKEVNCVIDIDTTSLIPLDEANTDYQAYLKWLDEGNEPLPADE